MNSIYIYKREASARSLPSQQTQSSHQCRSEIFWNPGPCSPFVQVFDLETIQATSLGSEGANLDGAFHPDSLSPDGASHPDPTLFDLGPSLAPSASPVPLSPPFLSLADDPALSPSPFSLPSLGLFPCGLLALEQSPSTGPVLLPVLGHELLLLPPLQYRPTRRPSSFEVLEAGIGTET